jgi:hypothetical protein
MSVHVTEEHLEAGRKLAAEARANGGLAPMDLGAFWHDNERAREDPFGKDIPQVPFGAQCTWECVFEELGIAQDQKRYLDDPSWQMELNRAYNDRAERTVGRRLLSESDPVKPADPDPPIRDLHQVFEMTNVWDDASQSWWLRARTSCRHCWIARKPGWPIRAPSS